MSPPALQSFTRRTCAFMEIWLAYSPFHMRSCTPLMCRPDKKIVLCLFFADCGMYHVGFIVQWRRSTADTASVPHLVSAEISSRRKIFLVSYKTEKLSSFHICLQTTREICDPPLHVFISASNALFCVVMLIPLPSGHPAFFSVSKMPDKSWLYTPQTVQQEHGPRRRPHKQHPDALIYCRLRTRRTIILLI